MFLGFTNPTRAAKQLEVLYEWKDMEFAFPNPSAKEAMLRSGAYIPGNSYPIDVDVWLQGKYADVIATNDAVPSPTHMTVTGYLITPKYG